MLGKYEQLKSLVKEDTKEQKEEFIKNLEKARIKKIYIKKNVFITNTHSGVRKFSRKGLLIVEFDKGQTHILDREGLDDITYCHYVTIENSIITTEKLIWQDVFLEYGEETRKILNK